MSQNPDAGERPELDPKTTTRLLKKAADSEFGGDVLAMLEHNSNASPVLGICTDPDCEALNDSCDPDTVDGFCEECDSETVQSVLILGGVM